MTLVIVGLLFGLVGLFWVLVINMVFADQQKPTVDLRDTGKAIPDSDRRASRAA